uniref:MAP6 domain containing 1 n=1 Tax=Salarias fasciatus TaxID=181472 RepID=A0A672F6Y2_SALFA
MAWPCISRVCCLARFWNQFDKSDLSVPLTIQNYSDISEGSPRDGTGTGSSARREHGHKPRDDYRPPGVPFPSLTQYKQDYKPWPIPRRENFPWISNGGSRAEGAADSPGRSAQLRAAEREETVDLGLMPLPCSSRQEYRPWTGVRPAKSARKTPPAQYSSPGTEASHVPRETSYQAAYSGEVSRSGALPQGDHASIRPAPGPQPGPAARPSLQQGGPPSRETSAEVGGVGQQLTATERRWSVNHEFSAHYSGLNTAGPRE